MRGLNHVHLIGNVGRKPEIKSLQDGTKVAKLSLATTETYRLKNGELESHTDWHIIILWRSLAELAVTYLQKGSLIYLEGRIRYRQYTDAGGQKKFVTEIIGDRLIMLSKKPAANEVVHITEPENGDIPF